MYLQTDKQWSGLPLDNTKYLIGRWGCTDVSLSNGREAIGLRKMNPKEVSDKLSFIDGMIIWSSTKNVGVNMVSYSRFFNKERAKQALKAPDEFCLVELDGWHWGLLWSMKTLLWIHDPLFGVRPVWPRYKNITKTVILKRA